MALRFENCAFPVDYVLLTFEFERLLSLDLQLPLVNLAVKIDQPGLGVLALAPALIWLDDQGIGKLLRVLEQLLRAL